MTNEEAIKAIEEYLDTADEAGHVFPIQFLNALDMAISALKPTCKIDESNFSMEQYRADLQSAYDCGKAEALKGGWIPIEEREPDNVHERVYVTQLVPKSPCKPNGTTVYITRFIDLHEKKKYITAWQPLPEPYKKGE